MSSPLERIATKRIAERRAKAEQRAGQVLAMLSEKGVKAKIIGSLVNGNFGLHSDVDFLVTELPEDLRYRIEADIEDVMLDIPFDVAYWDELTDEFKAALAARKGDL